MKGDANTTTMTAMATNFETHLQKQFQNIDKTKFTLRDFLTLQTQLMCEALEYTTEQELAKLDDLWEQTGERLFREHADRMRKLEAEAVEDAGMDTDVEGSSNTDTSSGGSANEVKQQNLESNPKKKSDIVRVEVLSGPHVGQVFRIKPRARAHSWVGRSTGPKFVKNGVSLSEDMEVSTTHGKIMLKNKRVYYQDHGSTNGSFLIIDGNESELEPSDVIELEDGMILRIGLGNLKIHLGD